MDLSQSDMAISQAADTKFEKFDPDGQFQIRDLGVKQATGGVVEARILAAAKPCQGNLGQHRHDVSFRCSMCSRDRPPSISRARAKWRSRRAPA